MHKHQKQIATIKHILRSLIYSSTPLLFACLGLTCFTSPQVKANKISFTIQAIIENECSVISQTNEEHTINIDGKMLGPHLNNLYACTTPLSINSTIKASESVTTHKLGATSLTQLPHTKNSSIAFSSVEIHLPMRNKKRTAKNHEPQQIQSIKKDISIIYTAY